MLCAIYNMDDTCRPAMHQVMYASRYKVKVSSYTVQYPVLRIAQSALHFTPWQACPIKHHLGFSGKQLMREDSLYTNIHMSIAKYLYVHTVSELWHYVEWKNLPKVWYGNTGYESGLILSSAVAQG